MNKYQKELNKASRALTNTLCGKYHFRIVRGFVRWECKNNNHFNCEPIECLKTLKYFYKK